MIVYRKLRPPDRAALTRHLLDLAPADRRMRFQSALADTAVEAYVARIDWSRTIIIGCFVEGRLRGVGEAALDQALWPRAAELAVSVETEWQGRGIGRELARRAANAARNRGTRSLTMICLTENRKMQRIARGLSGTLAFVDGAIAAEVDIVAPTPLSLLQEAVEDGQGAWLYLAEALRVA